MKIKYVKLKNIRSYIDEKIELPDGNTLLSGSIGSGKSTILLAIDFAFFGIQKNLSGADLLRHGSNTGYVEICFEKGEKNLIIKRKLKRQADRIAQVSGSLMIDGVENEYTPTELRARIIELFGYPLDATKKDRPIFKYTVYTPQEQVKHVLLSDDRLQILRKIFGIDKYEIIRANSKLLLTELRSSIRELNVMSSGLESSRNELSSANKRSDELNLLLGIEKKELDSLAIEIKDQTEQLRQLREKESKLKDIKQDYSVRLAMQDSKQKRLLQINSELAYISSKLQSVPISRNSTEISKSLQEKEKERSVSISELAVAKKDATRIESMSKGGKCVTCGQNIDVFSFSQTLQELKNIIVVNEQKIQTCNEDIKFLQQELSKAEHANLIRTQQEEFLKRITIYQDEKQNLEKEKHELSARISELSLLLSSQGDFSKKIQDAENILLNLNEMRLTKEKDKSKLEQQIKSNQLLAEELSKQILSMEQARSKSQDISALHDWLEGTFIPMMHTIEKHVMAALQKEFDSYFQKWFTLLMDDAMSVRINENFAPVIEQNGYETEFANLSGGEKTSVALSYRLALNMVINDMINTIQTKDILILDEPTDGFSTDQLDRLRDVINNLKLKQIVIVSHEPKIDAYVDNIIRIHKEGHVSKIVNN